VTSINLRKGPASKSATDAVVIGIVKQEDGTVVPYSAADVSAAFGRNFGSILASMGATGKPGEIVKLPSAGKLKPGLVVAVGLDTADPADHESIRRAAGAASRALAGRTSVTYALPADTVEQVRAVADGAMLGGYEFTRYKTFTGHKKADQRPPVDEIVIITALARDKAAQSATKTAQVVARAVNLTRDWINTPPGDFVPAVFADAAVAAAKAAKVGVRVLDEAALQRDGLGGLIGVGQGSANPPRLVTLTYRPRRAKTHLAFVGKGITFDSGGLSLKRGDGMMTMKCDMSGAAAVVAAVTAIADLNLPIRVTGYACLAENMPSGNATRPGDVLTMAGGKTVEVLNTDAEGRLVLADGLVKASEEQPDLLIDVATLTGACIVALGARVAGVMSNDDALLHEIPQIAERAGEPMWPLPIPEEMADKVRASKIADLSQHNTERAGGALFAAAFLREFVGEGISWAHLDIAGPAFNDAEPFGYTPKGGTGAAVRTLVQLATEKAEPR
jgi:leucyl aminopeptidase